MSTSLLPKFKRFNLKFYVKITSLFYLLRFSRRRVKSCAVTAEALIDACFQIVPRTPPGRCGLSISINIDSSYFWLQIFRSLLILQLIFSEMYIKGPPALDSVRVCSLLQPGMLMLMVRRLCLDILLSDIQIRSKLTLSKLRNHFSSCM